LKKIIHWFISFIWGMQLKKVYSEKNGWLEVWHMYGRNMLFSETANYSFGGLHTIFQQAFKWKPLDLPSHARVLILGFGAGSVARILLDELELDCIIDGVEHDPMIIELAKKYFELDSFNGKVNIHQQDALDYVFQCQQKYDLIVIDLFKDRLVPEAFHTKLFTIALDKILSDHSALFFNKMVVDEVTKEQFELLLENFKLLHGQTEDLKMNQENHILYFQKT